MLQDTGQKGNGAHTPAVRQVGDLRGPLLAVFVLASVITAVLSLDAVVVLTPVVFATAARLGPRSWP